MNEALVVAFPLREGFYILESDHGWYPIRVVGGCVVSMTEGREMSSHEAREFINGFRQGWKAAMEQENPPEARQ